MRSDLLGHLRRRTAQWLDLGAESAALIIASDHCLDATVCAILGAALLRDLTEPLDGTSQAVASVEGWIHVLFRDALERLGER